MKRSTTNYAPGSRDRWKDKRERRAWEDLLVRNKTKRKETIRATSGTKRKWRKKVQWVQHKPPSKNGGLCAPTAQRQETNCAPKLHKRAFFFNVIRERDRRAFRHITDALRRAWRNIWYTATGDKWKIFEKESIFYWRVAREHGQYTA